MMPDMLKPGQHFPGPIPGVDGAVFELSKHGPELRLFFSHMPDELVRSVENDEVWLGILRHGDLGIVPWKIGDRLKGDAQFHVYLYPPEYRPTDQLVPPSELYRVRITLIDSDSETVRAVRIVGVSHEMAGLFDELVNHQLGNFISHEEYDAQVSGYQSEFPDVDTVIEGAARFEKAKDTSTNMRPGLA